ncbi:biotin synthase [Vibrio navarrensis]|nr:biotin synthase [Vibrio navarrensis]
MMDSEIVISLVSVTLGLLLVIWAVRDLTKKRKLRQYNTFASDETPKTSLIESSAKFLSKATKSDASEINSTFINAGIYNLFWAKMFLPLKYGLLILGELLIALASYQWQWQSTSWLIIGILWLVVMLIAPDSYLNYRKNNLTYSISGKLPYLIDLMAVCVQTGMTIEAALVYLAREMYAFDKDLSYQLVRVNERARIVGLNQALDELYLRIYSNEMRSFVITINQSLQFGTSIYNVLTTLSNDIREMQLLRIEEKIGKLSAKMSVPLILFIMIPIVILVAAPGVMRMLLNA